MKVKQRIQKILSFIILASLLLAVALPLLPAQPAYAASATFYPNAHPETTSVDGGVYRASSGTWASVRDGAGTASYDEANSSEIRIQAANSTDWWTIMERFIMLFDTSSLPDDTTITSATLSLYGVHKQDPAGWTPDINIYSSNPSSNTWLTSSDYTTLGATAFSTAITYANWSTTGYNSFALNSAGLAAISKTGVSKFGARNANYDVANTAPTWVSDADALISFYTADYYSAYKPKLVIEYTVNAPTITTSPATNVASTTATLNGNVTATGGENPSVTVYWGTNDGGQVPASWTYSSAPTSPSQPQGVAAFYKNATGLSPGVLYYFSASATNSGGTGWGTTKSFTTSIVAPTVTTSAATNIGLTTATLNGNVTSTGGENPSVTIYWGLSDGGTTPGNWTYSSVPTSPSQPQGVGAFYKNATGLNPGTLYYFSAKATNSAGTGWGTTKSFTTSVTTPTIYVEAASNIAQTTARLNSTLDFDGGEACEIRFGYGDETQTAANFLLYDTVTSWVAGYTTGQHPYVDISGLTADHGYFYRVQAKNSIGTVTSTDEATFTTEATVAATSNFRAVPRATSISLSWTKGSGAAETLIRYKFTSYPTGITDGTLLYLGTGSSTSHTGLTSGTIVFYTAWGKSGTDYSSAVNLLAVTTAGAAAGDEIQAPTMPTNWLISTDYTTMSNFEPFFSTINDIADAVNVPRNTAWMVASLVFSMLVAFVVFNFRHDSLLPAGIALVICISIASAQHLLPLWMLFLTFIIIIGVGVSRRQVA